MRSATYYLLISLLLNAAIPSYGLADTLRGVREAETTRVRNDIAAITRQAADVCGIDYITDVDKTEVNNILDF